MAVEKINNSIRAQLELKKLLEDLKKLADDVVFAREGTTVMRSVANVLITNVEEEHKAEQFAPIVSILEASQDLIIRGNQAHEKLGVPPNMRPAEAKDLESGYAHKVGTHEKDVIDPLWRKAYKVDDTVEVACEKSVLKVGSINQQLFDRNAYRVTLYKSLYSQPAPPLEALSIKDPYLIDVAQVGTKKYTASQKFDISKWFLDSLEGSDEDLEKLVFTKAKENIQLIRNNNRYDELKKQAKSYRDQLKVLKPTIVELDHKLAYLDLINSHIKELES